MVTGRAAPQAPWNSSALRPGLEYPTMTLDELADVLVQQVLRENSFLFCRTTNGLIQNAIRHISNAIQGAGTWGKRATGSR